MLKVPKEVTAVIDERIEEFLTDGLRFNDSLREIARNAYLQGYRDAYGDPTVAPTLPATDLDNMERGE